MPLDFRSLPNFEFVARLHLDTVSTQAKTYILQQQLHFRTLRNIVKVVPCSSLSFDSSFIGEISCLFSSQLPLLLLPKDSLKFVEVHQGVSNTTDCMTSDQLYQYFWPLCRQSAYFADLWCRQILSSPRLRKQGQRLCSTWPEAKSFFWYFFYQADAHPRVLPLSAEVGSRLFYMPLDIICLI